MPVNKENYNKIITELNGKAQLVAVSKIKPVEDIMGLYQLGQRDFGENYVQELVDKAAQLPKDIRWHFIGHLQTNKVKYIVPFVHLIQGVDSLKLLKEINKQGAKINRQINVLLQVHIAQEETKFGFDETELASVMNNLHDFGNVKIMGVMGMASFSDDANIVQGEFKKLQSLFTQYAATNTLNCNMQILSMGMSGDYHIAIQQGSNMVRIGSLLFGARK
jgi:PLP dependent protein